MKRNNVHLTPTKEYPTTVWRTPDGGYHVRMRKKHPKTGQLREVDRGITAKSPKDAYAQLLALMEKRMASHERGQIPRVSTYADIWIGRKKAAKRAPGTITRYVRDLENHVTGNKDAGIASKPIADMLVDKVERADVLDWRDALPGNAVTVNSIFRILASMLRDAWLEYDIGKRCPVDGIEALPESPAYTLDEPNALSLDELRELLQGAERVSPKWYPLIAVWAFTGMRVSEACTLRWEDIRPDSDRHGPHILLRRTWSGPVVYERLKEEDWRLVPLCDELRAILQAHRRELLAAQAADDAPAQINAQRRAESGWLFPTRNGAQPIARQTSANVLRAIQGKLLAELESGRSPCLTLTPKGLRRTFNDLLRQSAPESVVRALMGHTKPAMTDRYATVSGRERGAAVAAVFTLAAPPLDPPSSPTSSPTSPPGSPTLGGSRGIRKPQKPR